MDNIDSIAELIAGIGQKARRAAVQIAAADTAHKNQALRAIASRLTESSSELLSANARDLQKAKENNISNALYDRLELTEARIESMVLGLQQVAELADPVGMIGEQKSQPSGLLIGKMRVPLGVIGIIYESRPNVTADAAALCIKSGNAAILRGGSEAINSNQAIAACVRAGLDDAGLPKDVVQVIETTDREAVGCLLKATEAVDVIVPRGGKGLVKRIAEDARVPVIKHLEGICHVYVDADADPEKALAIAVNSKTYRYGICGAAETLLVDEAIADDFLPQVQQAFAPHKVELRGCEKSCAAMSGAVKATEEDWSTEYLEPILSVRVVDGVQQAIEHIGYYGSQHTEAIVTENLSTARYFQRAVDSSSVMLNAATCFADGFQYGLGAEIGISTDKLHVRGPVGLEGLTTEKYLVTGDGTVRS